MPEFTIETTYRVPNFRQRNHRAGTVEEACRRAVDNDDWSCEIPDFECAGETFVTGIWKGYDAAYRGEAIPIPSQFEEGRQRQIDHFSALLAVVEEAARPTGLSQPDFERWLPRALAAIEKAKANIEQRPDPSDPAR